MNYANHPGPGPGSSPDLTTLTPARIFGENYTALLALASDDPRLQLPQDPGAILDGLAKRLHDYDGPLTEADFLDWSSKIIVREREYVALMREQAPAVRSGLWRVLKSCPDLLDDSTVEILIADMWCWCWQNFDALLEPGPAKLSTRINARAYWVARAWRTARLRERARHADLSELEPELEYENT